MTQNPLAALGNLRYRSQEEIDYYLNVALPKSKTADEMFRSRHIEEWRSAPGYPQFEVSKEGWVRNTGDQSLRGTKNGRDVPDRVRYHDPVDGKLRTVLVRKLRNRAFPELEPW